MNSSTRNNSLLGFFGLSVGILFWVNISLGSVNIPFLEVFHILTGKVSTNNTWEYIVLHYRLPKAIAAVIAGISLSVSGLIMQTFFRNPLAGPYVLGVSSGAGLGVALLTLGAGILPFLHVLTSSAFGLVLASGLGSFLVLLCILIVSKRMNDATSILIIGLMFSSFTSAIIGILSYFSQADALKKYTLWSLGNIGGLSWNAVVMLSLCCTLGLLIVITQLKSLNAFILGDKYAKSLGINLKTTQYSIIIATSLLAGSVTAFAGPIAFVGLAVPHIAKLIFKTANHHILFLATVLLGAITLLFCDTMSQLPGTDTILPINAITSILGAPVVIWLMLKKNKYL